MFIWAFGKLGLFCIKISISYLVSRILRLHSLRLLRLCSV